MYATTSPFLSCSNHYHRLLQIYPFPSSLALIPDSGRCRRHSAVKARAKFEKFDADGAKPPTTVAPVDEAFAELRQELDEDSDLPSDLEGAIRQSSQASAALINSGGMRGMVELLIPQIQFLDAEGAQGELWELSRVFLETLIEETGIQEEPGKGKSAMHARKKAMSRLIFHVQFSVQADNTVSMSSSWKKFQHSLQPKFTVPTTILKRSMSSSW